MKVICLSLMIGLAAISAEAAERVQDNRAWFPELNPPSVNKPGKRVQQGVIQDKRALIEQKAQEWSLGKFTAIPATNFDSELDRHLQIALTAKTTAALREFFHALNEDSFDSYLRFKTNGAKCAISFDGQLRHIIEYQQTNNHVAFPDEPLAKARKLWETINQRRDAPERARILSVDLDSLQVSVQTPKRPESGVAMLALTTTLKNLAGQASNDLIRYDETPQKIIERDGKFELLICRAIVRFTTVDQPGYVFVTFYWSNPDQRWLPWELVTDASSKFRSLF